MSANPPVKPFRYSTISDFHRCQKYYELKHILGEKDDSDKSADLAFGTCVHLGVQDLFEGGDGVDIFNVYWGLKRDRGLEYGRYGWDELLTLGQALLEIFRDEHKKKFAVLEYPRSVEKDVVLLEHKMYGKIGKHRFSGTADFIGYFQPFKNAEPMLSLVDWKTAAYPYDNYKLQVNEQIYGYVEMARQDLGLTLKQGVYGVAVKDPKNPRWQFKTAIITPEKLTKMLGNIEATCEAITTAKQFIRNPNACVQGKRVCPFFSRCHGGQASGGEET